MASNGARCAVVIELAVWWLRLERREFTGTISCDGQRCAGDLWGRLSSSASTDCGEEDLSAPRPSPDHPPGWPDTNRHRSPCACTHRHEKPGSATGTVTAALSCASPPTSFLTSRSCRSPPKFPKKSAHSRRTPPNAAAAAPADSFAENATDPQARVLGRRGFSAYPAWWAVFSTQWVSRSRSPEACRLSSSPAEIDRRLVSTSSNEVAGPRTVTSASP